MSVSQPQHIRTIQYRISAEFHKLKINKNLAFQTRILWKRHQNKAETKTVNHAHGFSVYNDTLSLVFPLYFDTSKSMFIEKNTEIVPVICIEGAVKSGGYARFDLAEALNKNPSAAAFSVDRTIALTKCPDPQAYVEVTFHYELMDEVDTTDQMSVLNASSLDLNMSRFEVGQTSQETQIKNIKSIIGRLENLAGGIKQKRDKTVTDVPEMRHRMQILEGENSRLKQANKQLEEKLRDNEEKWRNSKKQLEKQKINLEKTLEKKSKELSDRSKQLSSLNETVSRMGGSKDTKNQDYDQLKKKFDQAQKELSSYKSKQNSIEFTNNDSMDNASFGKQFGMAEQQKIQKLERDKIELQSQLAGASHRVGQLFNVAFEIGGAQLLDKLQSSIGLIQKN